MPSHKYVEMSNSRIKHFSGSLVGGSCPVLLNKIIKTPIKGGDIDGKSNILVGTVCSNPIKNITSKGELLSTMKNLKFGKGVRKSQENIKFLF